MCDTLVYSCPPPFPFAPLSLTRAPLSPSLSHVLRAWSGDKRYLKGDLVLHRGRVLECATQSCSLEPQSPFSIASCALFRQPLMILNGAVGVLAIAVAALLWLVCPAPQPPAPPPLCHLLLFRRSRQCHGQHVGLLCNCTMEFLCGY